MPVWPLDEAHWLEQIGGVRNEQMTLGIVGRSPVVDAARRSRRGDTVLVDGDWHIGPAQLHVVVVDQAFAIGLMLGFALVEVVAGDRVLRERSGFVGNGWVGDASSPSRSLCGTGRSSMAKIGSP